MVKSTNRPPSSKRTKEYLRVDGEPWRVAFGRLVPARGTPKKAGHLFSFVAEKIPFSFLKEVKKKIEYNGAKIEGVYMAHDSMGVARYGGRGRIFTRLGLHLKDYPLQLHYFSFYVIANKAHEREIETAILRAAGAQMSLNSRKVAGGFEPGNVQDYEPGTSFFERRQKKLISD